MGRSCKNVDTLSRHITKQEYEARKAEEEKLRGDDESIKPPSYLNPNAKKIFIYIVDQLKASGILTNLDNYILANTAIAIDRIQEAEKILNKDILNKDALRVKENYMKDFFKCCTELSLSPASRAKLANINIANKTDREDPLLQALRGEE